MDGRHIERKYWVGMFIAAGVMLLIGVLVSLWSIGKDPTLKDLELSIGAGLATSAVFTVVVAYFERSRARAESALVARMDAQERQRTEESRKEFEQLLVRLEVTTAPTLDGAQLREAKLVGLHLRNKSLKGAKLCKADLNNADLTGADLTDADLRGAILDDACLCQATLTGSRIYGATFVRAKLWGADLSDAKYGPTTDFTDADMTCSFDKDEDGNHVLRLTSVEGILPVSADGFVDQTYPPPIRTGAKYDFFLGAPDYWMKNAEEMCQDTSKIESWSRRNDDWDPSEKTAELLAQLADDDQDDGDRGDDDGEAVLPPAESP